MARQRQPVPVILESFPAPPTFIPANPPPSGPPSTPLPPLPGPSPLSERDTLHFLSSYRSSVYSARSSTPSDSRCDSTATVDNSSPPVAYSKTRRDSNLSLSSNGSTRHRTRNSPSPGFSISEEDLLGVRTTVNDLTRTAPLSDIEDTETENVLDDIPPSLSRKSLQHTPPRPESPDITTIISATPRPRKLSESRSRPRVASESLPSRSAPLSRRTSKATSLPYYHDDDDEPWQEDSFVSEYGVLLDNDLKAAADSDSDIDLHTPLPHLMLRHGLLSPRSKLLPSTLRSPSPQKLSRTDSIKSFASKTGVLKDERDTPKRRTRHRDGRLLRGGIGLTTGLGWSDSEDEDAPSALTRRISSLNLSRQSSFSSIKNPLSRSYSSGDGLRERASEPELPAINRKLAKPRSSLPSLPPTSFSKRPHTNRTSSSSAGSTFSLSISIPEDDAPPSSYPSISKIRRSSSEANVPQQRRASEPDPHEAITPSSTSSLSLSIPVTPAEDYFTPPQSPRDKMLPPLPVVPRPLKSSLKATTITDPSRTRAQSTSAQKVPSPPPFLNRTPSRSTYLSTAHSNPLPGEASPSPRVLQFNRNLYDQSRARSSTPTRPESALSGPPHSVHTTIPKPRTGTGMVYRTSPSSLAGPRLTSSLSGSASALRGPSAIAL